MTGRRWPALLLSLASAPLDVLAQSATNAAKVAIDAFGQKVGQEQVGLYSESQVRGFSLQDSGNYQLDGAYFIRSANIPDPALAGVTIRVGVNALGIDFPAPSGVVEYRTPTAAPGLHEDIEFGYRDYQTEVFNLRGTAAVRDGSLGIAYGANVFDEATSDGVQRQIRHAAVGPHWRPGSSLMIKGILTYDRFIKSGEYAMALPADVLTLPPPQDHPGNFHASWAHMSTRQLNWGVIARYTPDVRLMLQSSLLISDADRDRVDVTLLSLGPEGRGSATGISSRPFDILSGAFETRASWQLTGNQRLYGTLRARRTRSNVRPGVATLLGSFDPVAGVPATPEPPRPGPLAPTRDEIRQLTAGVGYEITLDGRLRLRGSLLRTDYVKDVTPPGEATRQNTADPWLYDASVSYSSGERLTLFATATRGLEESGLAPQNAANRQEVLPAVRATQYEIGVRLGLPRNWSFIGSLFEISKPTPGLDTTNQYRLIGEARHRGIELSLTGRPSTAVNVLAGVALLQAARLGELVDRALIEDRAPGVPAITGLLNLSYDLPALRGWSLDSQLNYTSRRLLTSRTGVHTPQYATLDIGARYSFDIGRRPSVLRLRVGNVFDEDEWVAGRSETLTRVSRRSYRATLAIAFDH